MINSLVACNGIEIQKNHSFTTKYDGNRSFTFAKLDWWKKSQNVSAFRYFINRWFWSQYFLDYNQTFKSLFYCKRNHFIIFHSFRELIYVSVMFKTRKKYRLTLIKLPFFPVGQRAQPQTTPAAITKVIFSQINNDTSGTYVQPQLILSQNHPAPPALIPQHSKTISNASSVASKMSNSAYSSTSDLPPKLPPQPQSPQYQQIRNNIPGGQVPTSTDYDIQKPVLPGYLSQLVWIVAEFSSLSILIKRV